MADGVRIKGQRRLDEFFAAISDDLDKARRLQHRIIDNGTARKVGTSTRRIMKSLISKGKSPILGHGKFAPYRGGYRREIKDYGSVRVDGKNWKKSLRPRNLKLTGEFLRKLDFNTAGGRTELGFFDEKSADKEKGHRDGANKQAKRPIIPIRKEKFVHSIASSIENLYEKRVTKFLDDKLKQAIRRTKGKQK